MIDKEEQEFKKLKHNDNSIISTINIGSNIDLV